MAVALCIMVDDPPTANTPTTTKTIAGTASEPAVIVQAQDVVVPLAEHQTVMHERDALHGRIDALRGQYQAAVHERDNLRARLERHETVEQLTLKCDGRSCHSAFTLIAPTPAETRLLGLAISAGWTIVGNQHFCAGCRR